MSTSSPGADDLGFELLPVDEDVVAPEIELAAATAALVDDESDPREVTGEAPEPFGVSWEFDYATGRFLRQGTAPARVVGIGALQQWCLAAISTARFAHPIFSDEFGRVRPNRPLGELVPDEIVDDVLAGIKDALMVHDRIADVEDLRGEFGLTTGILTVSFTVVTDEETPIPFADVELTGGLE